MMGSMKDRVNELTAGCETSIQTKHQRLERAVRSLDDVVTRLRSLNDKLCNNESPQHCKSTEQPQRSFAIVLTDAPNLIYEAIESCLKEISELENLLF